MVQLLVLAVLDHECQTQNYFDVWLVQGNSSITGRTIGLIMQVTKGHDLFITLYLDINKLCTETLLHQDCVVKLIL